MTTLSKWADLFDEIHRDNQRFIRSSFEAWVQNEYLQHGESWQMYGAAVTAGTAEALYTVAGTLGQGLVDLLRVGEGVKRGTALGVAQDALRVVSVVAGGLRVARLAGSVVKIGGPMSCTLSSSTKAAFLSGNTFRMGALFDRFATLFGGRAAVTAQTFAGTSSPLEMVGLMRILGMGATTRAVKSMAEVTALAAEARGPVIFGVRWATPAGVPGGGHTMVAFRDLLGRIRFADQFGRTVADVAEIGPVASVYHEAAVVLDALVVQALRWGAMGHFLAVPLAPVNPEGMQQLEMAVRKATGRPAPTTASTSPVAPPKPARPAPRPVPATYQVTTTEMCSQRTSEAPIVCQPVTYKSYTVGTNDNLHAISTRVYGTPRYWEVIYRANRGVIGPSPHNLRIGINLYIP
ncbi:MAG TPA: hypothetical protein VFQ61_36240 [Polyangiaceae bacterium]|nr:hypothetical protein [Polyangiaceae bacterium]